MMDDDSALDASLPEGPPNVGGRQLALHRALGELDQSLATYYEGALAVLAHTINPDRLSLAAHGIREIMDKLPRFIDLPVEASHTTLGTKANNLREEWERLRKRTRCLQDGEWVGEIDGAMSRFMQRVDDFFGWMVDQRPRKTEETARVLRELDPLDLPDPIVEQSALSYLAIRDYFVEVAHHRHSPEDEFHKRIAAFEIFLLERLVPRTYEDFDAIDQLLAGSSSADA
jgi:hypothetical protein